MKAVHKWIKSANKKEKRINNEININTTILYRLDI